MRKQGRERIAKSERPVFQHDPSTGLAELTLDRPHVLNALTSETLASIAAALETCERDPSVRVLIVSGRGRAFCTGADIKAQAAFDPAGSDAFVALGQRVFTALQDARFVTIAALHGYVLGGGLELAMSCDFRLASHDAVFGQPEASLGQLPGWGGTQLLPMLVGYGKALDLLLTGDRLDAASALSLGLIDDVADDVQSAARARAERYLGTAPASLGAIKNAVNAGRFQGIRSGLLAERAGVALCRQTSENTRRLLAFTQSAEVER